MHLAILIIYLLIYEEERLKNVGKERGGVRKREGENSEVHLNPLQLERGNAKFQINAMSPLGKGVKRESCNLFRNYRKEGERNQWYEIIGKQGS